MNDRQAYALRHPFNGDENWAATMAKCRWSVVIDRAHSASVVLAVDR